MTLCFTHTDAHLYVQPLLLLHTRTQTHTCVRSASFVQSRTPAPLATVSFYDIMRVGVRNTLSRTHINTHTPCLYACMSILYDMRLSQLCFGDVCELFITNTPTPTSALSFGMVPTSVLSWNSHAHTHTCTFMRTNTHAHSSHIHTHWCIRIRPRARTMTSAYTFTHAHCSVFSSYHFVWLAWDTPWTTSHQGSWSSSNYYPNVGYKYTHGVMCIYVCMCVYIYIYVCVVCVCVCVCMRTYMFRHHTYTLRLALCI
jgi:hypothetical protein